jgi:hypothetical protein
MVEVALRVPQENTWNLLQNFARIVLPENTVLLPQRLVLLVLMARHPFLLLL